MIAWDNTSPFVDATAEDRAFRQEVREWVTANVPENLRNVVRFERSALREWHFRLYQRGWIAPHWPKQYGGMDASLTQQIILFEEIERAGAPTPWPHGLDFIGPLIIEAGTPAQKARFLPRILSGEDLWCQGYSEPGAGSDLASLATRAEASEDGFIVNGHKIWTTNGDIADWMFALVRTDPAATPKHAGISMLLIDMHSPGVTRRLIETLKGEDEFAEEFFDNVFVPRENLLGDLNQGWRLATRLLGAERFNTAHPRSAAVYLNRARRIARTTGALDDPVVRTRLAELETDLLAFSAFYSHAAALHAANRAPASMAQTIKLAGSELWQRASELMMLVAGSRGPLVEDQSFDGAPMNVALDLFDGRRGTIGGGTPEIQRNILARRILELPA